MLAPLLLAAALAQAPAPTAPPTPASPNAPAPTNAPAAAAPVLPLDEAIRVAQERNPDLQQARARLEESRAGIARAWSGQLPQISAGATYTHSSEEGKFALPVAFAVRDVGTPGAPAGGALPGAPTTLIAVPSQVAEVTVQPQDQLALQLQATQALFAPPVWYGISAARTGARVAEESTEAARRELAFGVAQVYYNAVALKKTVAIQQRQLEIAREHEKDARLRFEAGVTPKITLLRGEIDRARAEQDLKRAENAFASAKVSLATLLDRGDTAFDVDVPPAPALPAGGEDLEAAALTDRPDVRAAGLGVRLQEQTRSATRATYLPTLGAFGRYQATNSGGLTGQKDSWAVGLSAAWNLFDGGLREAQLREASARIAQAEASRRSLENRAREEVRRARLDLDSAVANRAKAEEQRRLAEENQRLVEVNFRAGAATYLEVSDANAALTSASLSAVSEGLQADLAAVRLLQAAGRWQAHGSP